MYICKCMKTLRVDCNLFITWVGGCWGMGMGVGVVGVLDCLSVPSTPMTDPHTTPTPTLTTESRTSLTNPPRPVLKVNPPPLHSGQCMMYWLWSQTFRLSLPHSQQYFHHLPNASCCGTPHLFHALQIHFGFWCLQRPLLSHSRHKEPRGSSSS